VGGKGREMTQTLYAHMNKIKKDTSLLLNSAGRMIYMEQ
jgi:hypothetical protein